MSKSLQRSQITIGFHLGWKGQNIDLTLESNPKSKRCQEPIAKIIAADPKHNQLWKGGQNIGITIDTSPKSQKVAT